MTRFDGKRFVIERERPQQCDDCGKIAELRPYGPGGSCICFECMEKDEPAAVVRYHARLDAAAKEASS